MGELLNFPEPDQSPDELRRLAAEANQLIRDTERALEVAKSIRHYYLRRLGMIAMEEKPAPVKRKLDGSDRFDIFPDDDEMV